jgi:hemolysin III
VSHGLALVAVAALPILVQRAAVRGGTAAVIAASLFAGTMIVLNLVSTLYHALPIGRAKAWLNRLDHACIYVFIAGSYMPFVFGVLKGAWGWALFGVVWAAAALGVSAKLFYRLKHPLWSTGLYVAMGWVAMVAAVPLIERMSGAGVAWLGGRRVVLYSGRRGLFVRLEAALCTLRLAPVRDRRQHLPLLRGPVARGGLRQIKLRAHRSG